MTLHIVRLGTPRAPDEGLRIGTVRRPPRGVPKERFASDDWYDAWPIFDSFPRIREESCL